jgi:hypothetical protein
LAERNQAAAERLPQTTLGVYFLKGLNLGLRMKPWLRKRFLPLTQGGLAAAALAGGAGVAAAQAPVLDDLRKSYEEELAKTVSPLREGYCKALLTLEGQLAAKGDYAGATRVQEERREIERVMGRTPSLTMAASSATVGPEGVRLGRNGEAVGGLQLKEGAWTGWNASGASLRWALPAGLKGGGYGVVLEYETSGPGTLPLKICEDFHSLARTAKIEAGMAPGNAPRQLHLGTLRLRPGAGRLELKLTAAAHVPGFALTGLRLIPEDSDP